MKPSARWLGIVGAVALLGIALGARWRHPAASASVASSPASWASPPLASPQLNPATAFSPETAALPTGTTALAALTTSARTTVLALDREGAWLPLAGPSVIDESTAAWRGQTLAYLVMPGLDPMQNFVEAHDFGRGVTWRVQPEAGNAIFGFALDPAGAHLVYLEMNMQITGQHVPWWLVGVDLANGHKQLVLGGQHPDEAALAPVAWSRETLLLQGIAPFTGEKAGLWTLSVQDPQPKLVAAETTYVGVPRLSPDGDWIALPVSDPSALPRGYDAGEPPATALRLMDAETGATISTFSAPPGHIFADVIWGSDGHRLWAIDGAWNEARKVFDHNTVVEIVFTTTSAPRTAYAENASKITALAACPNGQWLAALRGEAGTEIGSDPATKPVAMFAEPGASVAWLVCLE